jgi:hypothetical protein
VASQSAFLEVSQFLAQSLGLTDEQSSLWTELEMVAFSILLHCQKYVRGVHSPATCANIVGNRCQRSMFVARDEHEKTDIILCPLLDCSHAWCKQCQQSIDDGLEHSCDGTSELDLLMGQNGWKYCPSKPASPRYHSRSEIYCNPPLSLACKTPIRKKSGCNHMAVSQYD